jgi:hypothetical protein
MDTGLIGKIQKAKQYAQEPERIRINVLTVTFDGANNDHSVTLSDDSWACTCDFFQTRGRCSHTMALEILFEKMLPDKVLAS